MTLGHVWFIYTVAIYATLLSVAGFLLTLFKD